MRIRSSVPSGFCLQTYGIGTSYKLLHANLKTVESGLVSNCGEFAIIKNRIVNFFPNADKFKCIPVAQPIRDKEISIFGTQHIC